MVSIPRFTRSSVPYALAALTVAVRLLYAWESSSSPFFFDPIVDARRFVDHADAIAAGDWLGDSAFWHPPLYPYVLALIRVACADGFFWAVRVAQALLGGLSALLLYRLSSAAVEETGGEADQVTPADGAIFRQIRAWLPAVTCGLFALYGPLIYFSGELLAVTLEIALYLALLCAAHDAVRRGGAARFALTGAVAGLSAITRPTILVFVAAFLTWLWLRRDGRPAGVALRSIWLPLCLPLAATVALVSWRNCHVSGDFVAISSNGGINLFIGNNAAYDSTVAIRPDTGWEDLVGEPEALGLVTPSQRSAYFTGKALAFVAGDPLGFAALMAKKVWLLTTGPEIKRNQDVYAARRHSRLLSGLMWDRGLSLPFGLVGALGVMGLAMTWHRRTPAIALLRLYTLSYAGSVVLFFVTSRYRLPLVPPLLFFTAWSAAELVVAWRAHRFRSAVAWSATALCAMVLLNLPSAPDPDDDPQLHHDLGEVALRRGEFSRAAAHSRRATELDESYLSARHNLAAALLHLGELGRAAEEAGRVLKERPRRPDTHVVLARAVAGLGQTDRAVRHFRMALAVAPAHLEANYYLGRLLYEGGHFGASVPHLARAALQRPDDFWMQYECGRALQLSGELTAARTRFEESLPVASSPAERSSALNAIGVTWLQAGDALQARSWFERAVAAGSREARANLENLPPEARRGID